MKWNVTATAAGTVLALLGAATPAAAQVIGRAQTFAIVGGSGISFNGVVSTISGDIGSPGAITGFPGSAVILPPFSNQGNTQRTTDAVADLLALYLSAPLAPGTATDIGGNDFSLGGAGGHYSPGRYTNLIAGGVALISRLLEFGSATTMICRSSCSTSLIKSWLPVFARSRWPCRKSVIALPTS